MHDGESEQATATVVMAKRAIAERLVLMLALAVVDLMGRVEDILLWVNRRRGTRENCPRSTRPW